MPDTVIPIVFPDYLIAVIEKDIPVDVLPWFDFDNFTIGKTRAPELGHAGVLFFSDAGVTKYYEFGRYDPPKNLGKVRKVNVPNLRMNKGKPTDDSLKAVLKAIAKASGQGGRIEGVYIEVPGKFNDMLKYAQAMEKENANPKRVPYDLLSNSCVHFAKRVVEKGGATTPWMVDPRPTSYIGEFRDDYPDVDYDAKTNVLKLGD